MNWWRIVTSAAKRIPWGSVLTFGAEKWLERRRRADEATRPGGQDTAPAPDAGAATTTTEGR